MQSLIRFALGALFLLIAAGDNFANAQSRCRVMDPTDTSLNVRTTPGGRIVDTLQNGLLVSVLDHARDRNGKPWVFVADYQSQTPIGWVFREFIACY
jgi:hypothetical protein